jgi:hypothetical protein
MNEKAAFLQQLCENLDSSSNAYKNYLAGGKTFRYAQELKKYNGAITSLLLTNKQLLNTALQQDAEALLHHYQEWTQKWEQLAALLQPQPDDIFVFENDITFPRPAAGRLEQAYREMN